MNENDIKPVQNSDENELKASLQRINETSSEQKPSENVVNPVLSPSFICPDFVLNFLQDKPIAIQKIILTSKLSQTQKKAVESVFKAGENELAINRAALKAIIEKLAMKYPEIQPWLTNETIFLGTFVFGFHDRSEQVKAILEIEKGKVPEVINGR